MYLFTIYDKYIHMCGISGIISIDGKPIVSLEKRLELMTKNLHHRGPDKFGIYHTPKKNFGFSNNRLSIVSPNEDVLLPFTKDQKNYLSFNGEIYNYEKIKDTLKKDNIKFSTNTDTEVLYEYLKKFKKKKLDDLNGMWTFAFYNQEKHELLLSRDLMGERHLFYTIIGNELIFCSEVKPIIMSSLIRHELDFESVITSWKFNACAPGRTLIKNISRLKPGTNLIFKDKKIELIKFQKLKLKKWLEFFKEKPSIEKIDEEFNKLLKEEINIRLPKDVGFTTPLSGGIDSSILVKIIREKIKKLSTFYAISNDVQETFEHKELDGMSETSFAEYLSNKLKTNHEIIKTDKDTSVKELKEASKNCFDGCVDFGVVNYSLLSKYVNNRKEKVIMFAEGPDELIGGYQVDIEADKIDKFFFKRKYLLNLLKNKFIKNLVVKLLKLKKNVEFEFKYDPFYTRVNHSVCPNDFLRSIIKNFDFNKLNDYGSIDKGYEDIFSDLDNTQKRSLVYATKTLPDMFNLRTDKAFMKFSVEARLPFQAINLVEFFIAMPREYRFKKNLGKFYLREYAKKNIDQILASGIKQGMGFALWENKDVQNYLKMEETIKDTNFFSFFPFKKNIKEILLDKGTHPGNLWTSYALINTFDELNKINKLKENGSNF